MPMLKSDEFNSFLITDKSIPIQIEAISKCFSRPAHFQNGEKWPSSGQRLIIIVDKKVGG